MTVRSLAAVISPRTAHKVNETSPTRVTARKPAMAHKHSDGVVVTRVQPRNVRCPRLTRRPGPESSDANQVSSPRWAPLGRSVPRLGQNRTAATGSGHCRCGTGQGHPVWLNRDPIFELGGINLYGFVENSPLNGYDAFGQCWNPFSPEFWAPLFQWLGKTDGPMAWDPNSNIALLAEEESAPEGYRDADGNPVSGGQLTAMVGGALPAGVLAAAAGRGASGKGTSGEGIATAASQMKKLSRAEIDKLIKANIHPHALKPNSKYDLFKDKAGNICVKPKDGSGPGDPTGININDL